MSNQPKHQATPYADVNPPDFKEACREFGHLIPIGHTVTPARFSSLISGKYKNFRALMCALTVLNTRLSYTRIQTPTKSWIRTLPLDHE